MKSLKNRAPSSPTLYLSREYKLALLGALGVGKSALTVKFLTRRFINEYDPDLEDSYTKEICIENQPISISIIDTCIKEDEDVLSKYDKYCNKADAFLLLYSVTSRQSFQTAARCLQEYSHFTNSQKTRNNGNKTVWALCANKTDLERYRQVSYSEGQVLALQHSCPFFEVSAAGDYRGIEKAIQDIVKELMREDDTRAASMNNLFISEDRSPTSLSADGSLGRANSFHFGSRMSLTGSNPTRQQKSETSPKQPKPLPKRTVSAFKIFKYFNKT